jgi:hypothetical protein
LSSPEFVFAYHVLYGFAQVNNEFRIGVNGA